MSCICYLYLDGTMCGRDSAEAPEFFLHHGFIDKIWADWQKKSLANKYVHFLSISHKMQGAPYYPSDVLDLKKQPGCVKVCYDETTVNNAKRVKTYLKGKIPKMISLVTRIVHDPIAKLLGGFQCEKSILWFRHAVLCVRVEASSKGWCF